MRNKMILIWVTLPLWVVFEMLVLCRPDFNDDFTCTTGKFFYSLGGFAQALIVFPFILSLLYLILAFLLREEVFRSWWKFTKFYLPIALILILIAGLTSSDGSWGVSADFDAEITIWLTSGLFLIISLILIAVKSWKLRKGNQKV